MANYKVEIKEVKGSCNSDIFKTMAECGDITATKITECVDKVVNITGYAICHIVAGEKEFDLNYYATNDGFISSGSNVFKESVERYFEKVELLKIVKIRTSKGTTFKVSPILVNEETGEVAE